MAAGLFCVLGMNHLPDLTRMKRARAAVVGLGEAGAE
jgi:hypothetical protein